MWFDLYSCQVSPRTEWVFVSVCADGVRGFGECSDGGDLSALRDALADVVTCFAGLDAATADTEAIGRAALDALDGRGDMLWRTVVGGVEQALCDLAARKAQVPLWRWLGGRETGRVRLYANINRALRSGDPDGAGEAAAAAIEAGFSAVKCAPFDLPLGDLPLLDAGLRRLRAVRAAIGPQVALMVDCHERLSLPDLLAGLPELRRLGVCWLEDSVDASDVGGLAEIRQATDALLAGGEFAYRASQILPAADKRLLDVVMPDVKHAGGVLNALRLARAVPDTQISPHNPSGPIGTAVSAHLVAAASNATSLEFAHGETPWRAELVYGAETVSDGHLQLPVGPGIGIDLCLGHPRLNHITTVTLQEAT